MSPLQPTRLLPNWAIASILTGFVGATYLYCINAGGGGVNQIDAEISRQLREEAKRKGGGS